MADDVYRVENFDLWSKFMQRKRAVGREIAGLDPTLLIEPVESNAWLFVSP